MEEEAEEAGAEALVVGQWEEGGMAVEEEEETDSIPTETNSTTVC